MNLMYRCSDIMAPSVPDPVAPLPVPPLPIVPPNPVHVSPDTDEDCVDKTNLCWRWLDRCKSFFFEKIMKEFCALSCGFCTPKSLAAGQARAAKENSPSYLQLG
ncbi:shTK domain protein [Oesophagostomum dentatum]|uniref:ShTK domain protein n=1 Tax=Oesophagostomum dentatum TaxID=61180 RepID=A0A0B1TCI6_OESDE|nr:shTK domain protein [Oesophagostomum dentatum]